MTEKPLLSHTVLLHLKEQQGQHVVTLERSLRLRSRSCLSMSEGHTAKPRVSNFTKHTWGSYNSNSGHPLSCTATSHHINKIQWRKCPSGQPQNVEPCPFNDLHKCDSAHTKHSYCHHPGSKWTRSSIRSRQPLLNTKDCGTKTPTSLQSCN